MKNYNITKLLIISLIITFIINSCKKEDEVVNQNQMGYNCVNNVCVATSGGQYVTLADCQSVCDNGNNNTTSFNCLNNACVDPGDGSGIYNSLEDCETQCGNSNITFNCVNNSCVDPGDGNGIYSSLQECEIECNDVSVTYNCINNACIDPGDGNGIYNSLTECLTECGGNTNCTNNNFSINGTQYSLTGIAEIINFNNMWNSTTNFEVRLFTSTITGNAGGGPSYAGIGEMILFDLNTNGSPQGSYIFNTDSSWPPNPSINTCTPKYFLNQDMSIYSQGMAFPNEGTSINNLTITENGNNNFDIEFSFNTADGLIEGCYSGVLTYWGTSGSSGGGSSGADFQNKINKSNPYSW